MKANKPMTSEQLNELMTVAVNMQRDAETDCKRPSAMFAYAVQVAVLELRKVRNDAAALAAENAGLKAALNPEVIPEVAVEAFTETVIMDHDWNETSEWSWVENDTDVIRAVLEAIKPETPATDAFLAEVRAQESKRVYESILDNPAVTDMESLVDWLEQNANDSVAFAAQLRKGVQS